MQPVRTMIAERRCGIAGLALRGVIVTGYALLICGCNTVQQQAAAVPDVPTDYRLRHPITLSESDHALELFIGSNRGALNAMQRADVLAFAQTWRREATGGVVVDLPVSTSNSRAAAEAMREIGSILTERGVPPKGIVVRNYHPPEGSLATIHMTYPKMIAQAGPCGLWPEDVGPSMNRDFFENQPPWNFGCATQRNLAAMVDNPADLVQPRGETPAYTMRRTKVLDSYRQGLPTGTKDAEKDVSKISTVPGGGGGGQ
ncbi:MAG: CpaD family pilus assembly protein [Beijerinckiaceae bacterium]|jgi:pilus assembly protein CpaD